eukprot:TRINITY_DN30004_c0_g1_i1.p1 TRINITY_DN30004_c0_g1~~TRINITY_DN30004_c0_g1_i1.p1  ORF type:complete len:383 (+),score=86.66 TRINITY_DN30004_c0_g1_i1:55-1203(+)
MSAALRVAVLALCSGWAAADLVMAEVQLAETCGDGERFLVEFSDGACNRVDPSEGYTAQFLEALKKVTPENADYIDLILAGTVKLDIRYGRSGDKLTLTAYANAGGFFDLGHCKGIMLKSFEFEEGQCVSAGGAAITVTRIDAPWVSPPPAIPAVDPVADRVPINVTDFTFDFGVDGGCSASATAHPTTQDLSVLNNVCVELPLEESTLSDAAWVDGLKVYGRFSCRGDSLDVLISTDPSCTNPATFQNAQFSFPATQLPVAACTKNYARLSTESLGLTLVIPVSMAYATCGCTEDACEPVSSPPSPSPPSPSPPSPPPSPSPQDTSGAESASSGSVVLVVVLVVVGLLLLGGGAALFLSRRAARKNKDFYADADVYVPSAE